MPNGSNHGLHDHTDWQIVADNLNFFTVSTNEIEPVLPRQLVIIKTNAVGSQILSKTGPLIFKVGGDNQG